MVISIIRRTLPRSYELLPKDGEKAKVWVGEKLWIEKRRAGGRGTAKVFFFRSKVWLPSDDNFPRLIERRRRRASERACAADGKILLLYFWPHSLSSAEKNEAETVQFLAQKIGHLLRSQIRALKAELYPSYLLDPIDDVRRSPCNLQSLDRNRTPNRTTETSLLGFFMNCTF